MFVREVAGGDIISLRLTGIANGTRFLRVPFLIHQGVCMHLYPISDEDAKRLDNNFKHHPPLDVGQARKYEEIRAAAKSLAMKLVNYCPPSRELSIALTELETAVMWANASIARNEKEKGE